LLGWQHALSYTARMLTGEDNTGSMLASMTGTSRTKRKKLLRSRDRFLVPRPQFRAAPKKAGLKMYNVFGPISTFCWPINFCFCVNSLRVQNGGCAGKFPARESFACASANQMKTRRQTITFKKKTICGILSVRSISKSRFRKINLFLRCLPYAVQDKNWMNKQQRDLFALFRANKPYHRNNNLCFD
jgi:hypothetical protein